MLWACSWLSVTEMNLNHARITIGLGVFAWEQQPRIRAFASPELLLRFTLFGTSIRGHRVVEFGQWKLIFWLVPLLIS